jgi:ubiquinone/menaquinone biosynthesis C-methylase UbiE
MTNSDSGFTGSIPGLYDRLLGPLLFEPYAAEVARRVATSAPDDVLEVAAGTGIVTEQLRAALPDARITATDLNAAMLEVAARRPALTDVIFQPADALNLPFDDASFDLVLCQFGVMFYPDRVGGNAEARRVLRTGGQYVLAIWDDLDRNPVSKLVEEAVAGAFPDDPPHFLSRTPFGYVEQARIEADLRTAGFNGVRIERVDCSSIVHFDDAAEGLIMGSPLRSELEQRGTDTLGRAKAAVTAALRPIDGQAMPMSALIVTARD